ncbi:MAG: flagellar basal body P-ring protein FlgI [Pirellulaceae bacterium]
MPLSAPTSSALPPPSAPNQFIGRQAANWNPNDSVRPASFQTQPGELPAPRSEDIQAAESADSALYKSPKAVRIKDITTLEGARTHQLSGMGLVTGLNGTGGKGALTKHFFRNHLRNSGIEVVDVSTKNVAAVSVSMNVPPDYKPGETIFAKVSVMDDATSLAGGTLELTVLKGMDGVQYATVSGSVDVDGFSVGGNAGSVGKNHPMVGKVEAQLQEKICDVDVFKGNRFRLLLKNKDHNTAARIATEINKMFPRSAEAQDSGCVEVLIPKGLINSPITFLTHIHELKVHPDNAARVVISRQMGTIVIGENVKISTVMFAKDNIVVSTSEAPIVSQPAPFSQGRTVELPRTQIQVVQEGGRYNVMEQHLTVSDLARALNALGVPPQDIISIFLEIERAGSLQAELVID